MIHHLRQNFANLFLSLFLGDQGCKQVYILLPISAHILLSRRACLNYPTQREVYLIYLLSLLVMSCDLINGMNIFE